MIKNVDVSVGSNKRIIPKFRGPYVKCEILPNDKFVVKDIEGFQHTQIPYEGVIISDNIKHWMRNCENY